MLHLAAAPQLQSAPAFIGSKRRYGAYREPCSRGATPRGECDGNARRYLATEHTDASIGARSGTRAKPPTCLSA